MPWTAEEIVRELAATDPKTEQSQGDVVCFFCNALVGLSGLEAQHESTCVWNAAVEREADK